MIEIPRVTTGQAAIDAPTSSVAARLRGMISNLSTQLHAAREAHIVRINTIATEYIDIQKEHIALILEENSRLKLRILELEMQRKEELRGSEGSGGSFEGRRAAPPEEAAEASGGGVEHLQGGHREPEGAQSNPSPEDPGT